MSDPQQAAADLAWQHIGAGRFADAEPLIRECIAAADQADHGLLWHLLGWLASVLNSLSRHDEATGVLQQAFETDDLPNRAEMRLRKSGRAVG